jgi:hypothetical protein
MKVTADQVIAGLQRRGVPLHVAQGVAMNFADESSFNTDINEQNPSAGRGGFGLAQWTGGRRVALENFASHRGTAASDLDTQLDFFMDENSTSEASAWQKVMGAQTSNEAAAQFVQHWERPRADYLAQRQAKYRGGSSDISMGTGDVHQWFTAQPAAQPNTATDPSLWQTVQDSAAQNQTLPWVTDMWARGSYDKPQADPNWSLDQKRIAADFAARNIPESEIKTYSEGRGAVGLTSVSEADYQDNLGRIKHDFDQRTRLANSGFTGTVLDIANSILDPVALAGDAMGGAFGHALVFGAKAGRLSNVLRGAAVGAAAGFGGTAATMANPNTNQMDLLAGTILGAGIGGVAGHLFAHPSTAFEAEGLRRAAANAVDAHEGLAMPGSVGAAKATPAKPFLDEDKLIAQVDDRDFAETFGGRFRVDLAAKMMEDDNHLINAAAGLVQDGVGKKGGAVNNISASEDMTRLFEEKVIYHEQVYKTQVKDYATRQDKSLKGIQIERKFNDEVDAYIRDRAAGREDRYDDAVRKAGDKQVSLYSDALKMMQNPFLREGFADARPVLNADVVKADPHFAPRFWEAPKLMEARRMFGEDAVSNLIGRAMKSANTALNDDVIERTSKAFTKAIMDRAHGLDDVTNFNLSQANLDGLLEMLEKNYGLIKEDVDALKWSLSGAGKKGTDKGADGHMKSRLLLDESMPGVMMRNNLTGTTEELKLSDLFSTDAKANFTRYMRSTMGRVALARYRWSDGAGNLVINGFTSDADWNKYIQLTKQRNAELISAGKITKAQADTGIKRMEFAYATILGRPTNTLDATNAGWTLRMLRKFNFARIMNQVGFAQLSEIGMPIASLGWKAALSQAPALRRVVNQDGASILKSGLADDLEAILGVGADRLTHSSNYNLEDITHLYEEPTSTWKDVVERGLNKANKATSEISGLTQANVMLERWTAAAIIQRFSDMAHGGKAFSAKRLADLGMDKDMTDRVMKMFKEEGNFEHETGFITGRKVMRAHFDKWADKEAREAFIRAAHRFSRQIIQKNDIGNMAMWMSHPLAKIFMQFRTFMVGAYAKQTLKSLNMRDGMALHQLMLTSGLATASYIAQMKLQAMGREDKDKFLSERLNPGNLAAAGFARAGVSSIIPMLVDTGLYASGNDALFSYTRTTGQASNMLFGNPTMGGIDDLTQATRGVAGLFRDGQWSQDEARSLTRILPFGNALPITMGLNAAISDLPKHPPRN